MRETKYKAWLKKEKKMIYVPIIDFRDKKIKTLYGQNCYEWNYSFDDIELLQYTGLKDKNGIELYDGYILKDDKKRLFVIEYKFGGFNLVPLSSSLNCLKDEFSWNPLGDMQTAAFVEESCEYIGNIYQNPELLEK